MTLLADVAVIGGGPAGSAAARLLASWGQSVIVLARAPRQPPLAESLPPSCVKLFDEIGVRAVMDRVRDPKHGSANRIPLDLTGTEFQRRVWDALRAIPAGERRSYAQIADAIGSPGSSRAVAGACASNRLAVVVPCHRVVRGDGGLSGYKWGVTRKRLLLEKEAK